MVFRPIYINQQDEGTYNIIHIQTSVLQRARGQFLNFCGSKISLFVFQNKHGQEKILLERNQYENNHIIKLFNMV